jgi:hypothetical protein
LHGIGPLHVPISTKSIGASTSTRASPDVRLNHAEAIRSFKEAVRLDPTAASAGGVALSYGPNINRR